MVSIHHDIHRASGLTQLVQSFLLWWSTILVYVMLAKNTRTSYAKLYVPATILPRICLALYIVDSPCVGITDSGQFQFPCLAMSKMPSNFLIILKLRHNTPLILVYLLFTVVTVKSYHQPWNFPPSSPRLPTIYNKSLVNSFLCTCCRPHHARCAEYLSL